MVMTLPRKAVWGLALLAVLGSAVGQTSDRPYDRLRRRMVADQLAARDITDPRVLEVMGEVPRHLFVPPAYRDEAYEDYPLPIEEGQTISQPYIVALMTQLLGLKGREKVLEIGTGSGYQAAVLSRLTAQVFTIEIHPGLAERASALLRELGYANVQVRAGDGYRGWPEMAPFDAVMVTCAVNHVPPALFEQLAEGGRLVLPMGGRFGSQTLTLITKIGGKARISRILPVRFVPMTGEAEKKRDV